MTTLGRSKTISFLAFGVLIFTANSCSQKRSAVPEQTAKINAEQIAKAYGLDSFDQIDAIRYTFTVPGANLSRSWEWEPKTDKVSYEGKDKDGKPIKVSYLRSELNTQPDAVKNEVDPAFINDNYWLLLPLHAYWDRSATVTDQGVQQLPLGNGSAELVAVTSCAQMVTGKEVATRRATLIHFRIRATKPPHSSSGGRMLADYRPRDSAAVGTDC